MTIRTEIHAYLSALNKYLARLNQADAEEVIKEIESHILDAVEAQEASGEAVDVAQILAGFGPARELASQYTDHVLQGTPPPKGFKAIQTISRGVTKSLWYSMAFFGYFMASALALVGLLKLWLPNQVGLWSSAQGNSVVITFTNADFPMSQEVMGWWLIPVALLASALIFTLTRRVLSVLKRGLP